LTGINTGILYNAHPLSDEQINELEKRVLMDQEAFAYLDANSKLCFALPGDVEVIKDLAWNYAYELTPGSKNFTKKVYKKFGIDSYRLEATFQKQSINDAWYTAGAVSLLDKGLLDAFILA
jgi:hypothetical protein